MKPVIAPSMGEAIDILGGTVARWARWLLRCIDIGLAVPDGTVPDSTDIEARFRKTTELLEDRPRLWRELEQGLQADGQVRLNDDLAMVIIGWDHWVRRERARRSNERHERN